MASNKVENNNLYRVLFWLKYKIKGVVRYIILSTVALITVFYIYSLSEQKLGKTYEVYLSLVNEIDKTRDAINKSKSSLLIWNELVTHHTERNGLDVEIVEDLINSIRDRYNIFNMQVELSVPKIRDDLKNNKYTGVEYSDVKFQYTALTDFDSFAFLNELFNNIPGSIQIESFTIERLPTAQKVLKGNINLEELDDGLVKTELLFKWQNIIDKQNSD